MVLHFESMCSFSSVLHLPALRDPFGIRTCFSSLIKHQKPNMKKSKDRNTITRLRSGSFLGCGDQIKSPGVWPASDLLFTDQTKISVQVLFQRNDLREWSLFIFWRGGRWRILGEHYRFFGKMTANKLPIRGGESKKDFRALVGIR